MHHDVHILDSWSSGLPQQSEGEANIDSSASHTGFLAPMDPALMLRSRDMMSRSLRTDGSGRKLPGGLSCEPSASSSSCAAKGARCTRLFGEADTDADRRRR